VAVTAADLLTQVGADSTDNTLAERCVTQAQAYVARYQLDSDPEALITVPPEIVDAAVLACAEDIFTRSKSQNGVMLTNYDEAEGGGGVVVRVARDPLVSVYPVLRRWYNPVTAV